MANPTPRELLNSVKRFLGNPPLDDSEILYRLLNNSLSFFWLAGPWEWTLTQATVSLADDTSDYTGTTGLYIYYARLHDQDHVKDLTVVPAFPTPNVRGCPEKVCAVDDTTIRVSPKPYGYSTLPVLEYWYKQEVPQIDSTNIDSEFTSIPFDWVWVWEEVLLAKAMEFVRDPRAGQVQVSSDGRYAANGQWARVFQAFQMIIQQTPMLRKVSGLFVGGVGK